MAPLATSWALDAAALGQGGAVCHRASRGDRPSQPPPLPSAPRAAALPRPACARGRGKGRGGHSQAWTHVLCAAHSEQQGAVTSPLRAPGGPGGRPESLAKQGQQYRAHDGVLYIRNFFEQTQFDVLAAECARLKPRLKAERSSTAEHRLGCYVPANAFVTQLFASAAVSWRLSCITGQRLYLSDFPLEYRSYPVGSHMAWHRDECLFAVPQVELVLTVSNCSDSATEWQDGSGAVHRQWMEPNSLLLVRAGGALHRVLPIKRGDRSIVKVVFTTTSDRLPSFEENLHNTYT